MIVVAIDPGPTSTGYVVWNTVVRKIVSTGDIENTELAELVKVWSKQTHDEVVMVIEKPALIGQQIWHQILDTCIWIGELKQMFEPKKTYFLTRQEVKKCILGKANIKAADKHIIQAMNERFPEGKGTKAKPGPLYGIKGDAWQALALCMAFEDLVLPLMEIM